MVLHDVQVSSLMIGKKSVKLFIDFIYINWIAQLSSRKQNFAS